MMMVKFLFKRVIFHREYRMCWRRICFYN